MSSAHIHDSAAAQKAGHNSTVPTMRRHCAARMYNAALSRPADVRTLMPVSGISRFKSRHSWSKNCVPAMPALRSWTRRRGTGTCNETSVLWDTAVWSLDTAVISQTVSSSCAGATSPGHSLVTTSLRMSSERLYSCSLWLTV